MNRSSRSFQSITQNRPANIGNSTRLHIRQPGNTRHQSHDAWLVPSTYSQQVQKVRVAGGRWQACALPETRQHDHWGRCGVWRGCGKFPTPHARGSIRKPPAAYNSQSAKAQQRSAELLICYILLVSCRLQQHVPGRLRRRN